MRVFGTYCGTDHEMQEMSDISLEKKSIVFSEAGVRKLATNVLTLTLIIDMDQPKFG